MNIYEINKELLDLMDSYIDEETGEIDEEVLERIKELNIERDTKLENVACWIKNLKAEAEALKAESDKLKARSKTCENKIESLKKFLLSATGGEKFTSTKCAISFRKSKTVECDLIDVTGLPEEFWKWGKPEIKKTEIKKYLEDGGQLDGCRIEEHQSVIIK